MSEKIFTLDDEANGLCRCILVNGEEIATSEICELLNEQQSDLNYLARFIGEFKVDEFKEKLRTLRTLEDKVDEQQATINKLQKRLERYEPEYSDEFLETVASINKISVEELKEMIHNERTR